MLIVIAGAQSRTAGTLRVERDSTVALYSLGRGYGVRSRALRLPLAPSRTNE